MLNFANERFWVSGNGRHGHCNVLNWNFLISENFMAVLLLVSFQKSDIKMDQILLCLPYHLVSRCC